MEQEELLPDVEAPISRLQTWKTLAIILSVCAICVGIYLLEGDYTNLWWAYLPLILGSGYLVSLPNSTRAIATRPLLKTILTAGAAASLALLVLTLRMLLSNKPIDWSNFMLHWLGSVLCLVMAFASWQGLRRKNSCPFEKSDLRIALGTFVMAFICRSWMVVTRSPIAIEDEIGVFSGGASPTVTALISPISTLGSFPALYYWLMQTLYIPFQPFIDYYAFHKVSVAAAGAISIAAWYLVIRFYNSQIVGVCFAILLSFLGWHWLNTRFIYSYPYDLALISIGTLFILMSIKRESVFLAMTAGLASFLTLLFEKIGIVIFPFIAYILMDHAVSRRSKEERKKLLLLGAVWIGTAAFLYVPFFMYGTNASNPERILHRHTGILANQAKYFAESGVSQFDAIWQMICEVLWQLQDCEFDQVRHLLKLKGPILDPVLSALFFLGLIQTVMTLHRSQESRLCLVGFGLFALPMIISFPMDSVGNHGVSHRFIGCSLFVTWMGARGAQLIAQRLVSSANHRRCMIGLCVASGFINVYFLFSHYLGSHNPRLIAGHKDLGIQRSSILSTVRSLAASGYAVLSYWNPRSLPEGWALDGIQFATGDFWNVVHINSVEVLRSKIISSAGSPLFVVVPAANAFLGKSYQDIPQQLQDLIPQYLWMPGPIDQHGSPTCWYAFVRAA